MIQQQIHEIECGQYYVNGDTTLLRVIDLQGDYVLMENCVTDKTEWFYFKRVETMKQVQPK